MKKIEIPEDTLKALYVLLCGVPYSLPETGEFYPESHQPMKDAHQWVLNWGKDKNIDSHGKNLSDTEINIFNKASEEVEKIISSPDNIDISDILIKSGNDIPKKSKIKFYRHMNSLFLNILLNRLDDLGKKAEQRSINARLKIVEIINVLQF